MPEFFSIICVAQLITLDELLRQLEGTRGHLLVGLIIFNLCTKIPKIMCKKICFVYGHLTFLRQPCESAGFLENSGFISRVVFEQLSLGPGLNWTCSVCRMLSFCTSLPQGKKKLESFVHLSNRLNFSNQHRDIK